MRDVTTNDVRIIIWCKKDEGFDAAAGEVRGVLKRLFDYALTCGLAPINPVLALPMRHVHKARSRERALSPDEVGVFLRAAFESNIRRQFKVALHLILLTMVRKSELLLARWAHVDFDKAEWHIPAEHSKTGKPRTVSLSTHRIHRHKNEDDTAHRGGRDHAVEAPTFAMIQSRAQAAGPAAGPADPASSGTASRPVPMIPRLNRKKVNSPVTGRKASVACTDVWMSVTPASASTARRWTAAMALRRSRLAQWHASGRSRHFTIDVMAS